MMSWDKVCKVSNLPIFEDEKVFLFLYVKGKKGYKIVSLPVLGVYKGNRTITDIQDEQILIDYFNDLNLENYKDNHKIKSINKLINDIDDNRIYLNGKHLKVFACRTRFYNLLSEVNIEKEDFYTYKPLVEYVKENKEYIEEFKKAESFAFALTKRNAC
jgi:hypothetical protein